MLRCDAKLVFKLSWMPDIIGIQKCKPCALRFTYAQTPGCRLAGIGLTDQSDREIAECINRDWRCRSVIDEDDLAWRNTLGTN